MIQVEKRRGSRKPSNFLVRNRRAVCGSTRLEETGGRSRHENTQPGKSIPTSRRQEEKRGKETVVISKTYLDELLRMNGGGVGGSSSHVVVDPSDVPGLHDSMQPQHGSHTVASRKNMVPNNGTPVGLPPNHTHREQESNQPLSQHDQWLHDLSKQAEEQRKKREAEKQREKDSIVEDYNPWGRPGGGAPIRSESGNLLTDYRTRARVAEKGGRSRQEDVHHTPTMNPPPASTVVTDPTPALSTQGDTTTPRFARLKREAEKQRENDSVAEEYNPWGRPGGGAPIRSESGNLLTDYRTRGRVAEVTGEVGRRQEDVYRTPNVNPLPVPKANRLPVPVTNSSLALLPQGDNTTPRFARGAGPYVDHYVLEQREHQRRKDQEHMAFIREQIAAKERQKLEERLHREREEREEAEKLAKERERLQREYQCEVERAHRKKEEAAQQQALLAQRIAEAEQRAKRAKVEARLTKATPRHRCSPPPITVHFNEPELPHQSSTLLLSRASHLRSPSMLQVNNPHSGQPDCQEPKKELRYGKQTVRPRGGPNNVPDPSKVRSGVQNNLRQGSVKGGVKLSAHETPSRIPVRQKTVRSHRHSSRPAQPAGTNRKPRTEQSPQLVLGNTLRRVQSPPVPALAKKLNHHHCSTATPDPSPTRLLSPPVPALAKKLNHRHCNTLTLEPSPTRLPSPPVPALAKKLSNHHRDTMTPDSSPMHAKSPSVPALTKRLEHSAVSTDVQLLGCDSQTDHSHSSPVPALAKQLQTMRTSSQLRFTHADHQTPSHNSQPTHTTTLEEAHSMPINRPPSCTLIITPLLPPLPTNTLTQTTQTAALHSSPLPSQGTLPLQGTLPMATRRQHTILQQLEILRQGIVSQRMNLDHRVTGILNRNTCIL